MAGFTNYQIESFNESLNGFIGLTNSQKDDLIAMIEIAHILAAKKKMQVKGKSFYLGKLRS